MTDERRLSEIAAKILADDADARADRVGLDHDDAEMISALGVAIAAEARVRRRLRIVVGFGMVAAVACAAAVGSTVIRARQLAPAPVVAVAAQAGAASAATSATSARVTNASGTASIIRAENRGAISGGEVVVAGDRISAGLDGRAAITLATGTQLVIENDGELTIASLERTQVLELRSGTVRADVAKLRADERFIVKTRDAEVEVRGTSFRVSVVPPDAECRAGTVTRVRVTEGDVVVRASGSEEHVLTDGSWPAECKPGAPPARLLMAPAPPTSRASVISPGAPHSATAASAAPPPARIAAPPPAAANPTTHAEADSQLAAQTALFADATAARRRGDVARAIDGYESLYRKHPSSPLAESAMVERMRLLAAHDRRLARVAAREYLARYPGGFAREEAVRVASQEQ